MANSSQKGSSFELGRKLTYKAYLGKPVKPYLDLLGLELKGLEVYQDTRRPFVTRKFMPTLAEGVAAVSQGYVSQIVLGSSYALPRTVSYKIDKAAYAGSLSVVTGVGFDVVAGFRADDLEFFTPLESTSTSKKPGQGKAELSLFPSTLAWAADAFTTGKKEGEHLLQLWLLYIQLLDSIGELPLTGNSMQTRPQSSAQFTASLARCKQLVRDLTDEAYDLIRYGESSISKTAQQLTTRDISIKRDSLRQPIGWRNGIEDAKGMLLSPTEMAAFLNDAKFPRSAARQSASAPQPAAQPSQAAPPPPQPAPPPAQPSTTQQQPPPAQPATGGQRTPRTPRASQPQYVPEVDGPQFASYPWARQVYRSSRICMPSAGPYASLMVGPAGTLKTTSVFAIGDGMPTVKLSVSSQAEIALLLGDYGRDRTGQWVPRLGVLAQAVRVSMLAAFCIALKRGAKIDAALARHRGNALAPLLEKLAKQPDDPEAREELDQAAFPYYPEVWGVFEDAYFEAKANAVGATVRVFVDEVHDAAENRSLETLLKVAFEDRRQIMLSLAGAGWMDLVAPNCHFVAAGNPDDAARNGGQFGRALRSRFSFTVPVGYPTSAIEQTIALNATASAGPMFDRRPSDLALARFDFEPPPWQSVQLKSEQSAAIQGFADWTRQERKTQMLPDCFDVRATVQVARTVSYLQTVGLSPRDAFSQALEPVYARLVNADEDGLPIANDVEMCRQKAGQIATHHRL